MPPADDAPAQLYNPRLWVWGADASKPRLLHTMIRVRDFDAAYRFYTQGFGMKPLGDRFDVPVRRSSAQFLGFDSYESGGCIELVQLWDAKGAYTHGTGYGHISIGVPDIGPTVSRLESMGAEVTLRPKPLLEGGPQVAFVKDPDGYDIELIETRRP